MRASQTDSTGSLPPLFCRGWAACAALLVLLAGAARAGDPLVAVDFKRLDLTLLPDGWSLKDPGDVSIKDDQAKGKVLCINHKADNDPTLEIKLDITKVRGCKVRATAWGKCSIQYSAMPGQAMGPMLAIIRRAKGGDGWRQGSCCGPANTNWQALVNTLDIPIDAEAVTVSLSVVKVIGEGHFDELRVEVEGAPPPNPFAGAGQAPTPPAQAPAPFGQAPPAPTPGVPAATVPSAASSLPTPAGAATAPKKTVEDDGILFSPEIAATLAAALKKGAAERSYAVVGPGAPLRDIEAKPLGKWSRIAVAGNLFGAPAAPENLLSTLPGFVVAQKAEVVIVAGGACGAHKLSYLQLHDWVDVAKVCLRLGAVPVLALPPAGALDELRRDMLEAAKAANCPAVDPKNATLAPLRMQQLLDLLERHVLDRAPKAQTAKEATKRPTVE